MAKRPNLYCGPIPAILVRVENHNGAYGRFFHIHGRFVTYDYTQHASNPRDVVSFQNKYSDLKWPGKTKLLFDNLQIWSQGDTDAEKEHAKSYAWSLRYRSVDVEVGEVGAMARTLKYLDDGIRRQGQLTGYPQTFGQFVCYVALASKAEAIVLERDDDDERFRPYIPGEAIWHIERLESQQYWCNQKQEAEAAA